MYFNENRYDIGASLQYRASQIFLLACLLIHYSDSTSDGSDVVAYSTDYA